MASDVNNKNKIDFYFWNGGGPEGTGHCGIGIEAGSQNESNYYSLWPKVDIFANPLTALAGIPVKGRIVESYADDQQNEKRPADMKISIPVDDQTAYKVREYMGKSKDAVDLGEKLYCLTPNFPMGFHFLKFVSRATLNPKNLNDHDALLVHQQLKSIVSSHCSKEAANIAREIGIDLSGRYFPWDYTPEALRNRLITVPGAQIERYQRPPLPPGSLNPDYCVL